MNKKIAGLAAVAGAFAVLGAGQQAMAASDSTVVTLDINDYVAVSATAAVTVTPTLADIMSNVVTNDDAIELTIDSTSGARVTWQGDGSVGTEGTIADNDITLSSNGSTFVAGDNTSELYSSTVAQQGVLVPIDVRISNLQNYAIGNHVNTLTFTVVAN